MLEFVGERIRKAREDKAVSQKKLGMSLGLSDKAISAYEAGRTFPPIDTLARLSSELQKPMSYFLSEDLNMVAIYDKLESAHQQLESAKTALEEVKRILKKQVK